MKKSINQIIGVAILGLIIIGSLIVSSILIPNTNIQIKNSFSKTTDKIKSFVLKMQVDDSKCVNELPKYFIIGDDYGEIKVRKGNNAGENIQQFLCP